MIDQQSVVSKVCSRTVGGALLAVAGVASILVGLAVAMTDSETVFYVAWSLAHQHRQGFELLQAGDRFRLLLTAIPYYVGLAVVVGVGQIAAGLAVTWGRDRRVGYGAAILGIAPLVTLPLAGLAGALIYLADDRSPSEE